MPVAVCGEPITSAKELFEKCSSGRAQQYALELKSKRCSYIKIPNKEKKIGTVDATSCIGIVYRTPEAVYVQHHDGRTLDTLLHALSDRVFASPRHIQTTLIGGCTTANDYAGLEKHTKKNLEQLVKFWKECRCTIDVQGWVIGAGNRYETLFSDFVVGQEGIYLVNQGEISHLNVAMKGQLIPELPHRLAVVLSDPSYFCIYDSSRDLPATRTLKMSRIRHSVQLRTLAETIQAMDDSSILQNFSTTPSMEPPYFAQMMRAMATYLLSTPVGSRAIPQKARLLDDHAVFAIQGEVVRMV